MSQGVAGNTAPLAWCAGAVIPIREEIIGVVKNELELLEDEALLTETKSARSQKNQEKSYAEKHFACLYFLLSQFW